MLNWKSVNFITVLFLGALLTCHPGSASGAEETTANGPSEPTAAAPVDGREEPSEAVDAEKQSRFDEAHRWISHGIFSTADWIDSFFGDERIDAEARKSRLRLQASIFAEEEVATEYDLRTKFRLNLPLLEDRLHVVITGEEDEEEFNPVPIDEVRQQFIESADADLSASLRYFFLATLRQNASFRTGLRLRSGIPVLFLEPRYRQTEEFDPWLFRFTQRVIWQSDEGLEARTIFDLERELPIGRKVLFRTSATGQWFEREKGYFYSLNFSIFQALSQYRALEYLWSNLYQTRPSNRLEEVLLRVVYRQKIWRDWLFFEAAPQISFPRDQDFDATPGFLLRLEVFFGAY